MSAAGGQEIGFESTQVPPTQANVWSHLFAEVLRLQALLQLPQLPLSVSGFTQTPPQSSVNGGVLQAATHAPLLQVRCPFAGFAGHGVHADPQTISPCLQAPHVPPPQFWPVAQARPQAPQLALLLSRSTSHPSAGLLLQSPLPALHTMLHWPPMQLAAPPAWLHALLQPPQLFVSVLVLVSQPLEAFPSQSPNPPAQETTAQLDAAHFSVAWFVLHALPQLLQLVGSFVRSTQAALLVFLPQSVSDGAQDMPQTGGVPPQVAMPLSGVAHGVQASPHLLGEVDASE